jgi:hypothetical protein
VGAPPPPHQALPTLDAQLAQLEAVVDALDSDSKRLEARAAAAAAALPTQRAGSSTLTSYYTAATKSGYSLLDKAAAAYQQSLQQLPSLPRMAATSSTAASAGGAASTATGPAPPFTLPLPKAPEHGAGGASAAQQATGGAAPHPVEEELQELSRRAVEPSATREAASGTHAGGVAP